MTTTTTITTTITASEQAQALMEYDNDFAPSTIYMYAKNGKLHLTSEEDNNAGTLLLHITDIGNKLYYYSTDLIIDLNNLRDYNS